MDIGDIYSVEIPTSDGHEQAGTRPAIIVQDTEYSKRLLTVLVVPLTSNLAAQSFPATFLVEPDAETGLRYDQWCWPSSYVQSTSAVWDRSSDG